MVIHLIAGPRNISTALMYSFAQRPDTVVLDEPFYGFFLRHTGIDHPGRDEIIASMPRDPAGIFGQIEKEETEKGIVFVKNMAHHLEGFDYRRIDRYRNVFLIRDPAQMLVSYAKVRTEPTLGDIGLRHQADLHGQLVAAGQSPLVLDGNEVRKNPESVLTKLCGALGIPFTEKMLRWPAGPRPEDGIWARHWYANVHQSRGFLPPDARAEQVPPHLEPVYAAALPYYHQLRQHAITP
ncbi:MAG: sulfotransferase family protein [Cytophagales bacterium]|nr:sulfotransferase family protein [Cytophagales bacterium]